MQRGDQLRDQCAEVGRHERRWRGGDRFPAGRLRGAGDPREDQCERPPQGGRKGAIGARAISDHYSRAAEPSTDQIDHGRRGLAGDLGGAPRGRGDGCDERTGAREQAVGYGEGRVEVGRHEAGPGSDAGGRPSEPLEVERSVEADDHRLGGRLVDHHETGIEQRDMHARPRAGQDSGTSPEILRQELGSGERAREHIGSIGGDPHARQLRNHSFHRLVRVVRDEPDPEPGRAQLHDPEAGAGHGIGAPPHHPVEVAAHDGTVARLVGGHVRTVCENQLPAAKPETKEGTVPDLLPFRGVRYTGAASLDAVIAPPYDVIDDDERVALEVRDPHNAVRLILPQPTADADAYEAAATTLATWRAAEVLATESTPALYAYSMSTPDDAAHPLHTLGVLGALGLPERPGVGDILPHERTLPKARSDRLALLRATRANLDPIWALSLSEGLTAMLEPIARPHVAVDDEGVRHELGIIDDAATVDAIRACVAKTPAVLADGHHRFETACNYRREAPGTPGVDEIMTLVVELADDQLAVHPIHRLIRGAPGDLRGALARTCEVVERGPNTERGIDALLEAMQAEDALGFVDGTGLASLRPLPEQVGAALAGLPECLQDVDAARFDVAVRPALGDATLAYRDDAHDVAGMVRAGHGDAAILLRAVTVDDIRAAADAGERMPEKTTFFAPKPRTGMVFRLLDEA